MADIYDSAPVQGTDPALRPFVISAHDTDEQPAHRGVYVGTGGDIVGRGVSGTQDVTFKNVADGSFLPVRFAYIRAAGTTAADLVGIR